MSSKVVKPKGPTETRPSDELMDHHLNQSLRTSHLGLEPRSRVINGSVDLYNRFKARDPVESLYAGAIVGHSQPAWTTVDI